MNIFPLRYYKEKVENIASKYPYDDAVFVSVSVWGWNYKDISKKSELENRVKFRFRDREFWCQGDSKNSLRLKYGDYMQLPPIEKRQVAHGAFFWIVE